MNKIGRKIYFDKQTGEVIVMINEKISPWAKPSTLEEDLNTYHELRYRSRDSYDFVQLGFGDYFQDFYDCNAFRVDPITKVVEFSYPDPNNPEIISFEDKPMSQQLIKLNNKLKTANEIYQELDKEVASLEDVRKAKIEQLKEACTLAVYDGFTSSLGYSFGFNAHDQDNLTQQLVVVISGDTSLINWKTKDSGVVELTPEQFKLITQEAKSHKIEQQTKYWGLESQVLSATTVAEIEAVVW